MTSIDIKELITTEFEQKVQNSFALATGFGVVFVDPQGNHIGNGSNFTDFCNCINSTEEGRQACARCNKQGFDVALRTHKPCIYICHAGLVNIVIPFHHNGHYLGALTAGQVKCSDVNDFFLCDCNMINHWMENPFLREYYAKVNIRDASQVEAVTESLANIQDYIFRSYIHYENEKSMQEQEKKLLLAEKQKAELESQLHCTQLEMLQKQIIPHFMFNVLNSATRLIAMGKNQTAQKMLMAYASMMRYKVTDSHAMVLLKDELKYIKDYLDIQNIRFSSKIIWNIDCETDIEETQVPFFSIQPFVENAIEHGILRQSNTGHLDVRCINTQNALTIHVIDDGVGMKPEQLNELRSILTCPSTYHPNEHIGIYNCVQRYRLLFGSRFHIKIDSKYHKGTIVKLTIDNEYNA